MEMKSERERERDTVQTLVCGVCLILTRKSERAIWQFEEAERGQKA